MEHEQGIQCIACPIFGPEDEVLAAVSGTAPAVRLPMERLLLFLPELQATALTISREMGYVPPRNVLEQPMARETVERATVPEG